MRRIDHRLEPGTPGTVRTLTSLHYGSAGGPKAYLQASLHADEIPGMLVMHHLMPLVAEAEAAGRLRGEVVLVPVANPVGLAQRILHGGVGRFELGSGENFNRGYPDFLAAVGPEVVRALGGDADANRVRIRAAMRAHVDAIVPVTELAALRKVLSGLACDADVVLDLHCDHEAVLHLYCEEPFWPQGEPLARLMGVEAALLAKDSGGASFDESMSGAWWKLGERLARERGNDGPAIPLACLAMTVELRGQIDVDHDLAARDARALFDFLVLRGIVDGPAPHLPPLRCTPTPLAGSEDLNAPHAGVIAYRMALGAEVAPGDVVADIVDPLAGPATPVRATCAGRLYTRSHKRYAVPGLTVGRVAGAVAFRSGSLLAP